MSNPLTAEINAIPEPRQMIFLREGIARESGGNINSLTILVSTDRCYLDICRGMPAAVKLRGRLYGDPGNNCPDLRITY